jgi:hypothetical protein
MTDFIARLYLIKNDGKTPNPYHALNSPLPAYANAMGYAPF